MLVNFNLGFHKEIYFAQILNFLLLYGQGEIIVIVFDFLQNVFEYSFILDNGYI